LEIIPMRDIDALVQVKRTLTPGQFRVADVEITLVRVDPGMVVLQVEGSKAVALIPEDLDRLASALQGMAAVLRESVG
jgi:hypothetical protein